MLFFLRRNMFLLVFLAVISSCRGFYEPITLDLEIPEGPPEYQSGWRSGCRSGLATRSFANAFVYAPDYGSGVYHHDSAFSTGWSQGWFACVIHMSNFAARPSMEYGPFQ